MIQIIHLNIIFVQTEFKFVLICIYDFMGRFVSRLYNKKPFLLYLV